MTITEQMPVAHEMIANDKAMSEMNAEGIDAFIAGVNHVADETGGDETKDFTATTIQTEDDIGGTPM